MRVYVAKDAKAAVLKETGKPAWMWKGTSLGGWGEVVESRPRREELRICKMKSPPGFPEGRSFVSGLLPRSRDPRRVFGTLFDLLSAAE